MGLRLTAVRVGEFKFQEREKTSWISEQKSDAISRCGIDVDSYGGLVNRNEKKSILKKVFFKYVWGSLSYAPKGWNLSRRSPLTLWITKSTR